MSAAAEPVDLVLYNGKVVSVDAAFHVYSAIAVRGEQIVALGYDELPRHYRARTLIDLHGRTLMPGFMDTHWHLNGVSPRHVDLEGVSSIERIQALLRAKAAQLGPGEWIEGYGWDENKLLERRTLLRADLDAAAPNNPVVLARAGMHSVVANSRALQAAHIQRGTPDPPSGLIEHDAQGEPTGLVRESIGLFFDLIPRPTAQQLEPSLLSGLRALLAKGITSYIMASGSIADEVPGGHASFQETYFSTFRTLYHDAGPELPRGAISIAYPGAQALRAYPYRTGHGDEHLRLGPIGEQAVDGGFSGPTAWTLADYKGQPGFRGRTYISRERLQEMADTCAELGWQMGLHAMGDAALRMTVEVYDHALQRFPQKDARWYLAHFAMLPPAPTLELMRKDRILIAAQPNFLYSFESRYADNLDGERLEHNNPLATPSRQYGLRMAFGSDNLPVDPRVGLYAAVTRRGPSGRVYGPEEAVSIRDAIRMYTANGPYLTKEEQRKGTLEVGKLADMIVLAQDPLQVSPQDLLSLTVDMTFVGGRKVYSRAEH